MNNSGLNYTGPLIHRFFSINTTVLYHPQLVESQMWNLGYRRLTLGLQHLWILISTVGPGMSLFQIPRGDCIFRTIVFVYYLWRNTCTYEYTLSTFLYRSTRSKKVLRMNFYYILFLHILLYIARYICINPLNVQRWILRLHNIIKYSLPSKTFLKCIL